MSAVTRAFVFAFGVATYLVAAKAHGRQLRLERELMGYWEVHFGGANPAFIEALWRHERVRYWSLAAVLAIGSVAFRIAAPRFRFALPLLAPGGERTALGAMLLHVLAPLTLAFVATGLWSVARLAIAVRNGVGESAARPTDWQSAVVLGTVGWWTLTLTMVVALAVFAFRRPA